MKLYLLLFSLLLLGCTSKSDKNGQKSKIESNLISEFKLSTSTLVDSSLFKRCDIIRLETNDDSFLREISRIYKTNENIFILDKTLNKLSVFDIHGNYQHKIENIGNGPHEYISLMDFCLDENNKEIILLCDRPYKIMKFKYDGQFVNETRLNELFRNIVIDNGYIYCNRNESNLSKTNKHEIYYLSGDGKKHGNILERIENITNKTYHTGSSLNKSKHVYYTRRFDNKIYRITNSELKEVYTLDFGKFNIPEDLSQEDNLKEFRRECEDKKYIYSITEFVENEHYFIFLTNQAICVYDKNKETFTGYPTIKNASLEIESNSFFANGNDKNSIIITINPAMLYMLKEFIGDNENITRLFDSVKEDDNPILLFYQFNSF